MFVVLASVASVAGCSSSNEKREERTSTNALATQLERDTGVSWSIVRDGFTESCTLFFETNGRVDSVELTTSSQHREGMASMIVSSILDRARPKH